MMLKCIGYIDETGRPVLFDSVNTLERNKGWIESGCLKFLYASRTCADELVVTDRKEGR